MKKFWSFNNENKCKSDAKQRTQPRPATYRRNWVNKISNIMTKLYFCIKKKLNNQIYIVKYEVTIFPRSHSKWRIIVIQNLDYALCVPNNWAFFRSFARTISMSKREFLANWLAFELHSPTKNVALLKIAILKID